MSAKKSEDVKFQLHIWSKLLEGRIALQKVVVATRKWEKECKSMEDSSGPADEATIKSLTKLLASMVKLRDSYRHKSQFINEEDENMPLNPEVYSIIDQEFLDERHDNYTKTRQEVIDKWYEKTKIGTMPKKGYTALELPTLQLINNALKDKDRLIKRTQIDRSDFNEGAVHPETFNDDDFYHQLLKEVISKEESRRWVELQRTKYKIKRKADTKATKGRKIKKDLIPKLVNFMAPSRPASERGKEVIPEKIRNELIKNLFSGGLKRTAPI